MRRAARGHGGVGSPLAAVPAALWRLGTAAVQPPPLPASTTCAPCPPSARPPPLQPDPRTLTSMQVSLELAAAFTRKNGRGSMYALCRPADAKCDAVSLLRLGSRACREGRWQRRPRQHPPAARPQANPAARLPCLGTPPAGSDLLRLRGQPLAGEDARPLVRPRSRAVPCLALPCIHAALGTRAARGPGRQRLGRVQSTLPGRRLRRQPPPPAYMPRHALPPTCARAPAGTPAASHPPAAACAATASALAHTLEWRAAPAALAACVTRCRGAGGCSGSVSGLHHGVGGRGCARAAPGLSLAVAARGRLLPEHAPPRARPMVQGLVCCDARPFLSGLTSVAVGCLPAGRAARPALWRGTAVRHADLRAGWAVTRERGACMLTLCTCAHPRSPASDPHLPAQGLCQGCCRPRVLLSGAHAVAVAALLAAPANCPPSPHADIPACKTVLQRASAVAVNVRECGPTGEPDNRF